MGSDNLFHRRKAKRVDQLARRKVRREPYAKVLIVCEGEKTEPRSIFDYAKGRYLIEKRADDPFDKVYCVFDKR